MQREDGRKWLTLKLLSKSFSDEGFERLETVAATRDNLREKIRCTGQFLSSQKTIVRNRMFRSGSIKGKT